MPTLSVRLPNGTEKRFPLVRQLTSVGSAPGNALVLEDGAVAAFALHIQNGPSGCTLAVHEGGPVTINGAKREEGPLKLGDVVRVGATELKVVEDGTPMPAARGSAADGGGHAALQDVDALQKLVFFSQRLLTRYEIDALLELMMDQVIELTRADKGFLILLQDNQPQIRVARNVSKENIDDAISRVSDSIIASVLKSRKPMIVQDALSDPDYKTSESVVNLKLLSVMCAPLTEKGEVFGLIYVGNDKFANHFEQKSLDLLTIWAAQASLILRNAMLVHELKSDNAELRRMLEEKRFGEIIGACASMKEVYRKIEKVAAANDISVLITGETGTGKELIARELHKRGPRANGPFVTINCGAIPENLLESELFGHVKGSFTGAVATRQGKFQAAHGGTLFLDEIGDMPMPLQVKILRALQEKQVVKVGETRPETVDLRVVAATNKVLEEEIKRGAFREDLYYRLNVVTIKLPPLRERGEDVAVIAKYFLSKYAREFNSKAKGFSPNAMIAMKKYAWPGNVRELENRIKKAVVLSEKALVGADDMELKPENLEPAMPLAQAKEEFQKRYINEVLERNNGNRTKTAKDLGVDPRTIFRHLEKLEAERTGRTLPPEDGEGPPPEAEA